MESKLHYKTRVMVILVATICAFLATSLAADTYRWKDKEGKTHYGATVPAEYADQPYDILNNAGIVIEHVERTTTLPPEIIEEEPEATGKQPLISEEVRRIESEKLLLIQYRSEEDIIEALNLEIAQLGYDSRLIRQSLESTSTSIRDQIRQAADQQRAGLPVSENQQKEIAGLYARHGRDERRQTAMLKREERIRTKFQSDLERYRYLTSDAEEPEPESETEPELELDTEPVDQG